MNIGSAVFDGLPRLFDLRGSLSLGLGIDPGNLRRNPNLQRSEPCLDRLRAVFDLPNLWITRCIFMNKFTGDVVRDGTRITEVEGAACPVVYAGSGHPGAALPDSTATLARFLLWQVNESLSSEYRSASAMACWRQIR